MRRTLIQPGVLTPRLEQADWVILDCRFDLARPEAGKKAYGESHIPGAVYAHLERDLSGPVTETSGRHPLPDAAALAAKLGRWGIGPGVQVVAYDDDNGAMAARAWWLLRWLGHDAAAVLDGGLRGWLAEGLPVSTEHPSPHPRIFDGKPRWTGTVSAMELATGLQGGRLLLVDARDRERYLGTKEPIDSVAGHIPGAVNMPYRENVDARGRFLPREVLHEQFTRIMGKRAPGDVAVMCGSGVTACQTILAMETAGLSGARLYAGSWSEWIRDPHRTVAGPGDRNA